MTAPSDRIGVTHAAGRYHPRDGSFLLAGAQDVLALGAGVLKLWAMPDPARWYPFDDWPQTSSLLEVLQTPLFRRVFDLPFSTFVVDAYRQAQPDIHYWRGAFDETERHAEQDEFEAATRYLATTYAGTGKTFVLQNWEGDWSVLGHSDPSRDPEPDHLDRMVEWVEARQEGVRRGRAGGPEGAALVLHALEVNLVVKAMEGRPCVTNDVVPRTSCDLYSYSAYETSIRGDDFVAALDHLASRAPTSAYFGDRAVMVGEFGCPENDFDAEFVRRSLSRTLDDALAWGCPYVIFWQVYCNEQNADGSHRGFWLVRPDGSRSTAWDVLAERLTTKQ